jgi:hypothetical protein
MDLGYGGEVGLARAPFFLSLICLLYESGGFIFIVVVIADTCPDNFCRSLCVCFSSYLSSVVTDVHGENETFVSLSSLLACAEVHCRGSTWP